MVEHNSLLSEAGLREAGQFQAGGTAVAAPGVGTWLLDAGHISHPLCRFTAAVFAESFMAGFAATFARYGSLIEGLDAAIVRGFLYNRVRPLGAPPEANGHPPREVFEQIVASSPALQERLATAEAVFAERRWRVDLQAWDEEVKPRLIALRNELHAVPLPMLADDELVAHVARCRDGFAEGIYQHHAHNAPALLPVGDFVLHAMRWTGRGPGEVLACLAGSSEVTQGGAAELAALGAAVAQAPDARRRVSEQSIDPAEVLAELSGDTGPVGAAARAYLDVLADHPVDGEDSVADAGSLEAPDLVVGRIRAAVDAGAASGRDDSDAAVERIRAEVPEADRADFDAVLAEARLVYRLRDERAVYGDRALGSVTRRALLEVGRRLRDRGALTDAGYAVELDPSEVGPLLLDGTGPSVEEVAARAHWRTSADYRDLPPLFGPPPAEPLPADWLPPAAARVHAALGFAVHAVLADAEPHGPSGPETAVTVRGLPASQGVHDGRARVIVDVDQLDRLQPGDVLVATSTGPAFNLVLPLLGAIVTDRGGLLSHAAIVAREFCVPAVVGCANATTLIPDGARVRVDGVNGVVTLL